MASEMEEYAGVQSEGKRTVSSQMLQTNIQPAILQAGVGYWLESPDPGPDGFRFRLQATFVLPKLF